MIGLNQAHNFLGPVTAKPLVLLGRSGDAFPLALFIDAFGREVVHNVVSNQIDLELAVGGGTFAEGARLINSDPTLNTDEAEGMSNI